MKAKLMSLIGKRLRAPERTIVYQVKKRGPKSLNITNYPKTDLFLYAKEETLAHHTKCSAVISHFVLKASS